MGKPREPINLIVAKGKKHLTKAEIEARQTGEVGPLEGGLDPPAYLTATQKKTFTKLAGQLSELGIMGVTDIDALGRYIISHDQYILAVKKLRKREIQDDPKRLEAWMRIQNTAFQQVQSSARDLGLTISSRCKLVVPKPQEPEKINKFKRFEKSG